MEETEAYLSSPIVLDVYRLLRLCVVQPWALPGAVIGSQCAKVRIVFRCRATCV